MWTEDTLTSFLHGAILYIMIGSSGVIRGTPSVGAGVHIGGIADGTSMIGTMLAIGGTLDV